MKLIIEKSVTVITPSIGKHTLIDAVRSVKEQDYSNLKHLIVSDGENYRDMINHVCVNEADHGQKLIITSVPWNTGAEGYYGHRIYAAYSHLMNSDYVMFLDEDNWYKPNHVSSMVQLMDAHPSDAFGYSLRTIYSPTKERVVDDNCESLGHWPIYWSVNYPNEQQQRLIDTSCFIFRRDFLEEKGHFWHSGWGGDRNFYRHVNGYFHHCTGKHTLCYRLDGNPNSVSQQFFIDGNLKMADYYDNGPYPWHKQ